MGDKPAAPYRTRQPARWRRNLILLGATVAAAVLAWSWQSLREEALAGAAFGAQAGCMCHYVSGRPLDQCEGDLKAAGLGRAAGLVSLSEDPETRTVHAGVPLLAGQSATFGAQTGCQLEPWDE